MKEAFRASLMGRVIGAIVVCLFAAFYWSAWYTVGLLRDQYHYGWGLPMASTVAFLFMLFVAVFQMTLCVGPTLPLQSLISARMRAQPSRSRRAAAGLSTAISAIVSEVLYDYGVPQLRLGIDDSPDWVHGLTWQRYGVALLAQIAVFVGAGVSRHVLRSSRARRLGSERGGPERI